MGIFQRHLPTLWVLGGVQENKGNILRELDVLGGAELALSWHLLPQKKAGSVNKL